MVIKPATPVGRRRRLVRRHWTFRHKHRPGRPRIDREAEQLVLRITEDLWERRNEEWTERQMKLPAALERHQRGNHAYFEDGERLLRLAQRAHDLWLARPQSERRKLLNLLLSNCIFDGGEPPQNTKNPSAGFLTLQKGPCVAYGGADGT